MPVKTEEGGRKVTGVDGAYVNTVTHVGDRDQVTPSYVGRGEELPDNLLAGETKRLEGLGAFNDDTHRDRQVAARGQRNKLRDALVKGPGVTNAVNNPKTPDMSAPPPGSPVAPPQVGIQATGDAAVPPATADDPSANLEDQNVPTLRKEAARLGVKGASKLNKADAITAITEARAAAATTGTTGTTGTDDTTPPSDE